MNFIVDTHAVLWFITESNKLPSKTRQLIESSENNCYISLASYWEIGIKHSLKRLDLGKPINEIFDIIEDSGFELLSISTNHILENTKLEFHHDDPFDRIIIAQSIVEDMSIITKDRYFPQYPVKTLWN